MSDNEEGYSEFDDDDDHIVKNVVWRDFKFIPPLPGFIIPKFQYRNILSDPQNWKKNLQGVTISANKAICCTIVMYPFICPDTLTRAWRPPRFILQSCFIPPKMHITHQIRQKITKDTNWVLVCLAENGSYMGIADFHIRWYCLMTRDKKQMIII